MDHLFSVVSAPNDVGAPLSRDTFAQRFNVAASRAKDRMYLVRSVELEHLSKGDLLRRSLSLRKEYNKTWQIPYSKEGL